MFLYSVVILLLDFLLLSSCGHSGSDGNSTQTVNSLNFGPANGSSVLYYVKQNDKNLYSAKGNGGLDVKQVYGQDDALTSSTGISLNASGQSSVLNNVNIKLTAIGDTPCSSAFRVNGNDSEIEVDTSKIHDLTVCQIHLDTSFNLNGQSLVSQNDFNVVLNNTFASYFASNDPLVLFLENQYKPNQKLTKENLPDFTKWLVQAVSKNAPDLFRNFPSNVNNFNALTSLQSIKELNLSDSNLTNIRAISMLSNLESLDLSGTRLSNLSRSDADLFSNLSSLKKLNVSHSNIPDFFLAEYFYKLSNKSPLTSFIDENIYDENNYGNCHYNRFSDDPSLVSDNEKGSSDLSLAPELRHPYGIKNLIGLTYLDLKGNSCLQADGTTVTGITKLDFIQNLTNLNYLDVSNNAITDLSPLTKVKFANSSISVKINDNGTKAKSLLSGDCQTQLGNSSFLALCSTLSPSPANHNPENPISPVTPVVDSYIVSCDGNPHCKIFTSTEDFVVPAGVTSINVYECAGGDGGSGGQAGMAGWAVAEKPSDYDHNPIAGYVDGGNGILFYETMPTPNHFNFAPYLAEKGKLGTLADQSFVGGNSTPNNVGVSYNGVLYCHGGKGGRGGNPGHLGKIGSFMYKPIDGHMPLAGESGADGQSYGLVNVGNMKNLVPGSSFTVTVGTGGTGGMGGFPAFNAGFSIIHENFPNCLTYVEYDKIPTEPRCGTNGETGSYGSKGTGGLIKITW